MSSLQLIKNPDVFLSTILFYDSILGNTDVIMTHIFKLFGSNGTNF